MPAAPLLSQETRPRLGRGLAALLAEANPGQLNQHGSENIKKVPIEFVRPGAKNPRQIFDEANLDELSDSIRERGIIQPIIVRPANGSVDTYEIVAGERRWRAAQRVGLHTIPIILMHLTDKEALEFSIVENVQRTDLNALEEARGYAQLASDYGYSHAEIGRAVGKSRSHVANTLRLMALPEHVQLMLKSGALTAGHARALLTAQEPASLADEIVARGLSVRDVERLGSSDNSYVAKRKQGGVADPTTQDLINRLTLSLGATVDIRQTKRSQEIRIRVHKLEQLEYICTKLLAE